MSPRSGTAIVPSTTLAMIVLAGCHPRPQPMQRPLPPLPLDTSIELLNLNTRQITATLRATGPVDGAATDADGRRRTFSADGVLFYLAPVYLRFDVKKLGDRQFLFGSNDSDYWLYSKQEDEFHCGLHGAPDDLPPDLPIRPDQIADALALKPIETSGQTIIQRVVDDYQQLLFLRACETGQSVVAKEYWIDRYPPRVVRRVVFRDANGVVEMESQLDDYRVLKDGALVLPHRLEARWPGAEMTLVFDVKRWRLEPSVSPGGRQFATPPECLP